METLQNPGSAENSFSDAEAILGQMPKFEERETSEPDTITDKVNKVAEQYLETDQPYDIDTAFDFLSTVNGIVTGKNAKSEIVENMFTGISNTGAADLVSPDKTIRKAIASNYLAAINACDGTNKKAELAYDAILNLHLFNDGNGRTARATYLLIKNGALEAEDEKFIAHSDRRATSNTFETAEKINSAWAVNIVALNKLVDSKVENGELPKLFEEVAFARTYGLPNLEEIKDTGLPEEEQKFVINKLFADDGLAGWATAIYLQKHRPDLLDESCRLNLRQPDNVIDCSRVVFPASKKYGEEGYASTYGAFQKEDWESFISTYRQLKVEQQKAVADLIVSPDYKIYDY